MVPTQPLSVSSPRLNRPFARVRHLVRIVGSAYCWFWVALMGCFASLFGILLFLPFNPWFDPNRRVMDRINHYWGRVTLWGLPRIGGEYVGLERIAQAKEPYLVCANHQSVADIIVLLSAFPHIKFIVKRKMFMVPFFAAQLRLSGYVQVSGAHPESVLVGTQKWLRRGVHVLNFPEGTRSPDGKLQRFHRSMFKIACDMHVKILPVAIAHTRDVIPKGTMLYGFWTGGYLQVLDPIDPGDDPAAAAAATKQAIQTALDAEARRPPRPWHGVIHVKG
jgi:1-acyl-sn-glycerol-3-phosphate acyltransferase